MSVLPLVLALTRRKWLFRGFTGKPECFPSSSNLMEFKLQILISLALNSCWHFCSALAFLWIPWSLALYTCSLGVSQPKIWEEFVHRFRGSRSVALFLWFSCSISVALKPWHLILQSSMLASFCLRPISTPTPPTLTSRHSQTLTQT